MSAGTGVVLGLLIGLVGGWFLAGRQYGSTTRGSKANLTPSVLSGHALATPQLLAWIDAATQGWLILTPDLTIGYINSKAERLLQVSNNLLVRGQALDEVLAVPELEEAIVSVRHQQRPQRCEWEQQRIPLEAIVLPGSDEWLLVLLQNRQSLEAQQQQQERWVSDVAHELKTPLTALMLVSDRLEGAVSEDDGVLVERLQRELRRLQLMVEDLLELSRLENILPRDKVDYSALNLEQLVEGAWNSIRPLADQRDVSLTINTNEPGLLLGDQRRLHRAVLNLLDNALRYSPNHGCVEVEILPSGGWWLLCVRDHGPGLSESDLSNMFQRFYRGDPSRARSNRSGSGLGLAIVQQIAVNHGGRIQARNHPNGGTSMELLLPRGQA
ncbi:cell wall metabolism sensor histidine kinase WalK [Synechococcus sp. CS-197]|uniref:sensor histidine kinase n=1 Tax=Synechococcus sp. CS-197 TaxID=2847985 RepID=UPI00000BAFCB|nr:HAMP domain-containing sensor histidine kinase [Synechococcus sp. CS-197]AAB38750.1 sensor kinase PhoR [Synechococcus sp. WH 7803]CAK23972.1 Two-component system sensor histidine kinase, phosphate sensing PhoR [Synechococcus sp. WH 7803]